MHNSRLRSAGSSEIPVAPVDQGYESGKIVPSSSHREAAELRHHMIWGCVSERAAVLMIMSGIVEVVHRFEHWTRSL